MSTEESSDVEEIVREAHRWRFLLDSGDVGLEDRRAFELWLEADPRHGDHFERAETFAEAMRRLCVDDLDPALRRPNFGAHLTDFVTGLNRLIATRRRQFAAATAAIAVTVSSVLIFGHVGQSSAPARQPLFTETHATEIGEIETLILTDGTELTLGAASAVEITYFDLKREVNLTAGTAFFDVAHEPDRSFRVSAGNLEASVLGTAFEVSRFENSFRVAVAEGEVEVSHPFVFAGLTTVFRTRRTLTENQQVSVTSQGDIKHTRPVSMAAIGSWRDDFLYYEGAPLSELIADANRYSPRHVVIEGDADAVGALGIRGGFSARDIEGMLLALAEIHPLNIDMGDPNEIRIRASGAE